MTQAQALAPNIVATLQDLVDKKAAFASLPIGGASELVKQDLQDLASDASAFENALIAKAPVSSSYSFFNSATVRRKIKLRPTCLAKLMASSRPSTEHSPRHWFRTVLKNAPLHTTIIYVCFYTFEGVYDGFSW